MRGILYVVSTPIGNLKDVTLRALETLKEVDLIACEDTRHTLKLLSHYQIRKPLTSYYSYNQLRKTDSIIHQLKEGKKIALVSDAGTPGISDPGYVLIREAIKEGIPITVIPGPSAILVALVLSGAPTRRFLFEGFLPAKRGARQNRLKKLAEQTEDYTIVLYESPHRLIATLEDIQELMGDCQIACVREVTKIYEEAQRGRVSDVIETFRARTIKGEIVLIIYPD